MRPVAVHVTQAFYDTHFAGSGTGTGAQGIQGIQGIRGLQGIQGIQGVSGSSEGPSAWGDLRATQLLYEGDDVSLVPRWSGGDVVKLKSGTFTQTISDTENGAMISPNNTTITLAGFWSSLSPARDLTQLQFAVITLQLFEDGLLLLESSVTVGRLPPTTNVELTDVVIDGTGGGGGGGTTAPTATLSASPLSVISAGSGDMKPVALTIAFSGGTAQLFVTAVDEGVDGNLPASVTPITDITSGASVTAGTRTVHLGSVNGQHSYVTITLRVTSTSGAVASSAVTIYVEYD